MAESFSNIDEIIFSFLKDEISENERKVLKDWLASDPSHKDYFKQIYRIWNTVDLLKDDEHEIEKVLEKVKFNIHHNDEVLQSKVPVTRNILLTLGKWAAVVLISLCTGAFLHHWNVKSPPAPAPQSAYNEVTVPMGSKSKIRLPDGTEVTLNAGSRLTYKMDYGKTLREVEFSGEGYFKVAKHKDKPFIVHTSKANIKALGTEFNVKAYPEENMVETILVEGSVVINETKTSAHKGAKNSESVVLKPGQKLRIMEDSKNKLQKEQKIESRNEPNHTQTNLVEPVEEHPEIILGISNTQVETSWKDKRWIVQGIDLENLAVLLSRKFNVNIHLKDPELRKYKFSGIIENETVEQVFNIIKYTIPIAYTIDKGEAFWSVNRNREKDYREAY